VVLAWKTHKPLFDHTGYDGRIGVYEFLYVDEEIQDMIIEGASINKIRNFINSRNFQFMVEDAIEKVKQGLTSLDELIRIIPYRQIVQVYNKNTTR